MYIKSFLKRYTFNIPGKKKKKHIKATKAAPFRIAPQQQVKVQLSTMFSQSVAVHLYNVIQFKTITFEP